MIGGPVHPDIARAIARTVEVELARAAEDARRRRASRRVRVRRPRGRTDPTDL